ncbi:MAG: hypothetical protein IK127_04660 [Clostridia bacterium]|nr:hypothetical protein [Clostridia bacterium]
MNKATNDYQIDSRVHRPKIEAYDPDTMVFATLTPDMRATPEQIAMLEEASCHDIVYEEDCPELSDSMIEAFRKAAQARDAKRKVG